MKSRQLQKIYKSIFSWLLLLCVISLTACIDLASTQSLSKNKNYLFSKKTQVYVMRGGLGGVFSTGMNHLQNTLETNYKIKTESTVWYKAETLSNYIITHYGSAELPGPIILVGHSLGANEQIKVAKNLDKAHIPVALLITVDAVSPLKVPPNVKYVLNLYKPSFVPMFSGLRVDAIDPARTRIDNIDVRTLNNVEVNHFTMDKHKEIQKKMLGAILDCKSEETNSGK